MPPLLSPYLQTRRFQAVAPYLRGDILDLGCGRAEIMSLLKENQSYSGIEGNQRIIQFLREQHPTRRFYLMDLDTGHLDLEQSFDTILMIAVIEHLSNPSHLLQQLPKYLKPGGQLVLTTPTPLGDSIHRIGARLGLFSMIAVHDHEIIFSYKSLHPILLDCGFIVSAYHRFLLGGNQLFICSPLKEIDN